MKTFTVKDFITYNSPCFSCGSKISFKIGVSFIKNRQPSTYLVPIVSSDFIEIDLKINYNNGLKLKILPKTNKFTVSSMKGLTTYLEKHNLFLRSYCDNCRTCIDSQFLEFNLLKEFIKPVEISDERLFVRNNNYKYELYSYFTHSYSVLIISDQTNIANNSIRIELPLLPMYKLKNKEHFIKKVKTYILFS
jgi:hypothetical protein